MLKVIVIMTLVISMVCPLYAGGFVSVKQSYFEQDDDNFKENTYPLALEVGYSFNKYLETGVELSQTKYETNHNSTFDLDSIMATARLKYPLNNKLSIYALAGLGWGWFNDKDIQGTQKCNRLATMETLNAKESLAAKLGAGVQYNFNDNWAAFLEADYKYTDTGDQSSIDTWGWDVVGVGLKCYF